MTQRCALITGGTTGLGEATARRLHDAGHTVLVTHMVGTGGASEWQQAQAAQGYTFKVYEVDVSDYDSCQEMARQIEADGHQVDILVNNAGITRDGTFRKMGKDKWDAVLRTNLDSMYNVSKPFVDGMTTRNWGRVVNISSVNGTKGQFGQTNYSAAKAGIQGFTKALALEVARKGVTVNSVSPGYAATSMVAAVDAEILEKQIVSQIPIGRLGKPEEIAATIGFLCSEDAGYITGANIAVNGGMHMC
ncbi:MAG: acetoacetyl-CoA reductase [Alcaligenaceae bacterium]|nr:acetoacetyl-CoA reductase [Alcaligenaceae bacterium]